MSTIERRKEELERKRQKLAELRKAREERKNSLLDAQKKEKELGATRDPRSRKDIDELVASLVGDRPYSPRSSQASYSSPGSSRHVSVPGSPARSGSLQSISVAAGTGVNVGVGGSEAGIGAPVVERPPVEKIMANFTSAEYLLLEIPPKDKVLYNKEVQTIEDDSEYDFPLSMRSDPRRMAGMQQRLKGDGDETDDDTRSVIETPLDREGLTGDEDEEMEEPVKEPPRELTEDERKSILTSEGFAEFFDFSSRVVERALNQKYDFMIDYTRGDEGKDEADSGKDVKLACVFFDERWSRNRSVTNIDWSPKFPELALAAYNKSQLAINEPDGVVLVWNMHLPDRPEFVFHAQSDVMTAIFSEFHPNYVVGGTYSGQILLWDNRAKSSLPVLKTPLSAAGHTHPIYSMTMVGTQNAHNLVTASTDGLVCSWTLDMLAQPQEILDLVHPSHPKTEEVAITTLGFPANETTTFWVGTEEGNVYQANRYDRAGSKAGINPNDTYKGHYGMITGLHFHPFFGAADFSDVFLTTSVDWTIKLWRAKSLSKPSTTPHTIQPLCTFDEASDDYIYDAKWSPVHPSLFAAVDGSGRLSLFDLNVETEVPIVSIPVGVSPAGPASTSTSAGMSTSSVNVASGPGGSVGGPSVGGSGLGGDGAFGFGGKALNKVAWDREGRKTAVGSSDGRVFVYDVGEIAQPKADEWNHFQRTLAELEQQQQHQQVSDL